jgi:cyclomaltodextrinase
MPNFDTFAFTPMMPKLNTENPEVKEYLLRAASYWIEEIGIDGWRLDVANEVDHRFWRDFRAVVKRANPEVYILGEVWHNSLAWLQGDQFDAVMNYPITNIALDFFAKGSIDAYQFASGIDSIHSAYPLSVNEVAFNLLDSHDTPRLLTMSGGDRQRMMLAAVFQLTYYGAPCIYYGDEVGMGGENDPDCRRTMVWERNKQDRALFSFYKKMIELRKKHRALRDGTFTFLLAKAGRKEIAYERRDKENDFVIIMNTNEQGSLIKLEVFDGVWSNVFTGKEYVVKKGDLQVKLGSLDFMILWKKR